MAKTKIKAKSLRAISEKDRKEMVKLFKRNKTTADVHVKFRKYNRYQIGAVKQHITKGDYSRA
ncbi:MAG TPA: hypothetical protein P5136_01375 [Methanofastidiosum sp.]|nr:hypothetical protein [Methanofastidiosum sp.]